MSARGPVLDGPGRAASRVDLADRAARLVTRWVAAYTGGVAGVVAEERRAELASDLWEQLSHGRGAGVPAIAVALSILGRAAAGAPADLRWRYGRRAAAQKGPHPRGGAIMRGNLARNWWLALAVLAGLGQAVVGVMIAVHERNPGAYAGGALVSAAGLVVLVGVGLRRRSRFAGDLLVGVGVLPLLPFWWLLAPTLVALVVIVAAAIDAAEARSLGRSTAPPSTWDRVAVAGLALAVAAAAALAIIGGGPLALAGVAAVIVIAGAIALLIRRPRGAI